MDSILTEVRVACNVEADDDSFDTELLLDINSDFAKLWQIGAGPETPFTVESEIETWADFSDDKLLVSFAKSFLCASTRIKFDPPANSTLLEALKQQQAEAEWRIFMHTEGHA